MAVILNLETSTRVCSAGIARQGQMVSLREDHSGSHSHASLLAVFIGEVIREAGLNPTDVEAVAISRGPGSYTGLRIGASAAKGFCYALDIPLIAVDTMKALTVHAMHILSAGHPGLAIAPGTDLLFCPMIDARRMEVYYAVFRSDLSVTENTRATVIGEDSFDKLLTSHTVVFFGDGASKCESVIDKPNALFAANIWPSALGMAGESFRMFKKREFADVAYFEPFYLKDFVAGTPRVKGLHS